MCGFASGSRQRKLRTLQQDWGRRLRKIRDVKLVLTMGGEVVQRKARSLYPAITEGRDSRHCPMEGYARFLQGVV